MLKFLIALFITASTCFASTPLELRIRHAAQSPDPVRTFLALPVEQPPTPKVDPGGADWEYTYVHYSFCQTENSCFFNHMNEIVGIVLCGWEFQSGSSGCPGIAHNSVAFDVAKLVVMNDASCAYVFGGDTACADLCVAAGMTYDSNRQTCITAFQSTVNTLISNLCAGNISDYYFTRQMCKAAEDVVACETYYANYYKSTIADLIIDCP